MVLALIDHAKLKINANYIVLASIDHANLKIKDMIRQMIYQKIKLIHIQLNVIGKIIT